MASCGRILDGEPNPELGGRTRAPQLSMLELAARL